MESKGKESKELMLLLLLLLPLGFEEGEVVERAAEREKESVERGSCGEERKQRAVQRREGGERLGVGDLPHHSSQFLHTTPQHLPNKVHCQTT